MIDQILAFLHSGNVVVYLAALLGVSEALAPLTGGKVGGIVHGLIEVLKFLKDKVFIAPQA
jgi:hypothetical protein